MEVRELICIGCPLGCPLTVQIEKEEIKVSGNTCKKGELYAVNEVTHPARTVTSTVTVINGDIKRVSVKTKEDIPKDKIFACMDELKSVKVEAPVKIGDIIIKNCAGTGISVIATRNVERL